MNCLTYLLDLLKVGREFTILYNGDHCIGVNKKEIIEVNNTFKLSLLSNSILSKNYSMIEDFHDLETIKNIFNLKPEETAILTNYYNRWKKEN